ncbi:AMP-binding protein [Marinomonas balearica]|uniref:Long-subunit acyl-CoA synthetase (AMP-forming) n=1 Tax=Marinomonas balearica TaxID=491947 RepID=A0A4V3CGR2_9GAMM|nr:AMP-binding protein [Marinomonas balearica]TDO98712.1 long-subunit acyl-CoA synthetase (AMP-forming) [Marinomonas balearica]
MWYLSSKNSMDIALTDSNVSLTYQEMGAAIQDRREWLESLGVGRVGIALDNQVEWVLFDLACQGAGICCVPAPSFFSQKQLEHLVTESGIELLICSNGVESGIFCPSEETPFKTIYSQKIKHVQDAQMPEGTSKVTFTSGSTGAPKGVCLSEESQLNVARSLVDAIAIDSVKHLCILPFAVLLENIAGVYAPLMVGGTVVTKRADELGFVGSKLISPEKLLYQISVEQPNSLILVPELLNVLVMACSKGWQPPKSLLFVAVGGGKVSSKLIHQAKSFGLPVYQGYGLSECASVVSLNTPDNDLESSAGHALPHTSVEVIDHELVVRENLFLGYLNKPESFYPNAFYTGDLVSLENNTLSIIGRKKNLMINSFGRNISPEWLEAELMATRMMRSVMVFGDDRPHCGGVFVPITDDISDEQIQQSVEKLNESLPDYAQIKVWFKSERLFESLPHCVTPSGKLIRKAILDHFEQDIDQLYL